MELMAASRRSLAVVRALHLTELQQGLSPPIVQTKQAISQMRAKKYASLSSSQKRKKKLILKNNKKAIS